jgi:hypothetical protein
MIDFVNLKIKLTQYFRCARVFIEINDYICISICIYNVFLTKKN